MLALLVCHTNTDPMWISPIFKKITLVIFGQGYQWWKFVFIGQNGQGYQQWKFLIFEPFWPRIPMVKGHFWPRIPMVKDFVFSWSYLAEDTKSFVFWAFSAKDTNCETFCFFVIIFGLGYQRCFFLVIFGQGYQWWKFWLVLVICGQGYQRWKFWLVLVIFGQGYQQWHIFGQAYFYSGAHPGGLFGYHDRPLCITGMLLSIKDEW